MIKISYNIIVKIKIEVAIMCGLRSITLGTTNIEQTKHSWLTYSGLNYEELLENSIRFGDADISPGTTSIYTSSK